MRNMKITRRVVLSLLLLVGLKSSVVGATGMIDLTTSGDVPLTSGYGGEAYHFADYGIYANTDGTYNLTMPGVSIGEVHFASSIDNAIGLYSNFNGSISFLGDRNKQLAFAENGTSRAIENIKGTLNLNSIHIYLNGNTKSSIYNDTNGVITLGSGLYFSGESADGIYAIHNKGNMTITGDMVYNSSYTEKVINNEGILTIDGSIQVKGDITHNHGAITRINLVNGTMIGLIEGDIIQSNDNFSMKLNDDTYFVPQFNTINPIFGIEMNGGYISMAGSLAKSFSNRYGVWNDAYHTLKLQNFKTNGNGGFDIATDLANNAGDKIVFSGTTPENISVPFYIYNKNNNGGVPITPVDGKRVTIAITPSDSTMSIKAERLYLDNSELVYVPIIKKSETTDGVFWNFVGWGETGETKQLNQESDQHKDGFGLNATELDNTLKRLNDIRTDPSEIGVWLRGESGKMKIRSYSYDYDLMSGGYDWDYDSNAAKMFLGFGISYAKNDCDTGIIGNTKSMGYNIYGSWLGKENKDYVDVIVKYGTLDKDYAGFDDNNVFVTGDYDKNLFSIAAKYGRRIDREDGWYFEPSVGLTWGRISSADYTDSQGIKIHADSSTSKMASLGVQVGKNVKGTEYYGKFEVRHDFDGKMHVSVPDSNLPGSSVYDDMGGTWYKVGIGAARKIDKNNSFYIDIEKDFGNKVKKPYSIGAGYRYTW